MTIAIFRAAEFLWGYSIHDVKYLIRLGALDHAGVADFFLVPRLEG